MVNEIRAEDKFNSILAEMSELYIRKNEAYGNSFHTTYTEEGPAAARIRLSDKLNRYKALTRRLSPEKVTPCEESLRDTLIDLACYAVMAAMEIG